MRPAETASGQQSRRYPGATDPPGRSGPTPRAAPCMHPVTRIRMSCVRSHCGMNCLMTRCIVAPEDAYGYAFIIILCNSTVNDDNRQSGACGTTDRPTDNLDRPTQESRVREGVRC